MCTGTTTPTDFDFLPMNPLVAQLLPLLPKDFNTRMAILQQLNTTIVQEEFAKQSLQHSQREMVTAQRHADLQQSNGQLLAENNRLKSELHKLDLIRTNVQDITSSSFSNNTTPLDLSELARAPSTSTSAPHLLQQQPRQGQQQQQQQQQQQHWDLLAAIDRKVARSSALSASRVSAVPLVSSTTSTTSLSSSSPSTTGATGSTGSTSSFRTVRSSGSPRSIENGKSFFRTCRQRLNATTFDMFITDIRGLKINAVSREEVYEKASKLFGAENQDLIVQLRELLYNV